MLVHHIISLFSFVLFADSVSGGTFEYNTTSFLLNGESFQLIGGQMDPQRIPWQYWKQRLSMARAMGLNTIFSYVYWNLLEPEQGQHDTDELNNIYAFVEDAQSAGLQVVLRVGPYICGEHEWGGFPAWLNNIQNMTVRSNNPQFLDATASYLSWLSQWLDPLMVANDGPIIMVQIENEYGFYSDDHQYTSALAEQFKNNFNSVFYTNDGSSPEALAAGQIPSILAEIDGGSPQEGFANRTQYVDESSQGPNLDGEFYITWIDHWSTTDGHQSIENNTQTIQIDQERLEWVLSNDHSFSIYMFHGGTNWGFHNGANYDTRLTPVTTSYDYGAPLDETGRPNNVYHALRESLLPYSPEGSIPDVPEVEPMISIASIKVEPAFALFDGLPSPTSRDSPTNMETLGQWYGFTLYRHTVVNSLSGKVSIDQGAKDRVIVYVNRERVCVIDAMYETPQSVEINLAPGDVLDLLNENMGRVHFGGVIPWQTKGIVGDVSVGDTTLSGWDIYTLPLENGMDVPNGAPRPENITSASDPIFYQGTFSVDTIGDTFLELPGWTKGVVYVNGVNLGRFWTIGPQQSYYLPGCYLKESDNVIQILNLEPTGNEGTVKGVTQRTWANNPDPDAP